MFGLWRMWRHHLANEAHRRVIRAHPTAKREARPTLGTRCRTEDEWFAYERLWTPQLASHRALMRLFYTKEIRRAQVNDDQFALDKAEAALARTERPIQWQDIAAYARYMGMAPK
jgi:hypothetical protein